MKKIFIVYYSKTGFVKRYAEWIAREVGGVPMPYQQAAQTAIGPEDVVIFGSRVHAGTVQNLPKIKERFKDGRNLVVYAVGAMPANVTDEVEKLWENNFTALERAQIPRFYMQGGLSYEKMGLIDRTIMKMVAKMTKGKKDKTEKEAAFSARIQQSFDGSSKEAIEPLAAHVKTML